MRAASVVPRPLIALLVAALVAVLGLGVVPPGAPAAGLTHNGWTTTAAVSATTVSRGSSVSVSVFVTAERSQTALVDLEIYSGSGQKVYQRYWDNQSFSAATRRTFAASWTVPAGEPLDRHTVRIGIFSAGWGTLYHWNNEAATFTVTTAPASTTTTTAATTTTTRPTTTTTAATTTTTRPTTTTTAATTTTTAATTTTTAPPSTGLPPRPAGFPATLQLGAGDGPGGASALRARAPFGFRYQYLAGGVNTGSGWATWNANGEFVTHYIQDSRQAGITPVFTYYMLYQSRPGSSMGEADGLRANLSTASTMTAYYNDLKLFFQKAAAAGGTTVLHVEPDLWAYIQQRASADDGRTVPVSVGSSGQADVAGLPDNAAGFAQAIVRLRDRYAANVRLGYHFSTWGTGNDVLYSDPADSVVDQLGVRTGNFYRSLGARFDVAFTDIADRDAAFKQFVYGDGGAAWMNADDYRRSTVYIGAFVRTAGLRAVLWQLPLGNTKMRAVNNTWGHYQDNKVEWLLDEPARTHLDAYARAGVVAFLFGGGAGGTTCACDAIGDGVTNPAPINGNTGTSLNADDDGGFWGDRVAAYYRTGAMAIP